MKSEKNETDIKTTPSKALCNLTEMFESQTSRINLMEQQFLELASRVTCIEGPKFRARYFR